jgi:hypothetical protein
MHLLVPSWPLLLWSALAATLICVWMLGVLMPEAGARALAPRAGRAPRAQALLLGVLVYPLFYALAFQLLREANLLVGAGLGVGHALLLAVIALPNQVPAPAAVQRALAVIAYGALLGFVYVTP